MLWLTLDRPERLNAVTVPMLEDLAAELEQAGADPDVRVVALTGAGRAFCSGADLASDDARPAPDDADRPTDARTLDRANEVVTALTELPQPTVAVVNGAAAGVGCSLALACDLTVARASAYFLLAFANVGLMPDGGATALVAASVGRARAMRMALLAERVPASTALEWGLIGAMADDEGFDREVAETLERLAAGPPLAYAATKQAVNQASVGQLPEAMRREGSGQRRLLTSRDFAEGVAAFGERRRPVFGGE